MRVVILDNYNSISKWAAEYMIKSIQQYKPTEEKPFILGLPTGSTPIGTYNELIKQHQKGIISFKNVITFNMDEYVGLSTDHPECYHYFMYERLFNNIDIPLRNINILDGNAEDLKVECEEYENKIRNVGGINIFLGGIGPDGHIAFNEPGSSLGSRTRVQTLTMIQ